MHLMDVIKSICWSIKIAKIKTPLASWMLMLGINLIYYIHTIVKITLKYLSKFIINTHEIKQITKKK